MARPSLCLVEQELLELVQYLSEIGKVFLLCEVTNDEAQSVFIENARQCALTEFVPEHVSIYAVNPRYLIGLTLVCDAQRILFYETSVGKTAIVRQLTPALHMDGEESKSTLMMMFAGLCASCFALLDDYSFCKTMAPHVSTLVTISSGDAGAGAGATEEGRSSSSPRNCVRFVSLSSLLQ